MKKRYFLGVGVVLSIICVLVLTTQLFALLPDCVDLWNICQEDCSGDPVFWVYGDGSSGVECNNSHYPCSDHWGPIPCI